MPKSSNYEIKTTLAIDGEKKFKAAMEEANRAMRVHKADLRSVAAEYEYSGDQQRFFSQRAELLAEEMKQQEAVVEALQRAVKESGDMYGTAARQTDGYRIQLSNATAKMFEMRKEAEQANRDLEDLGRDSGRIGRQIERGIGDAAEDTAGKLDGVFENLQKEINAIRSNTTVSAFVDIGGAIGGAVSNLDAFAESSREYRRSMSFLEQNAGLFGIEMGTVKDLFFEMASVTGEVDSSVEALSNLMAAGFDAEELTAAVDLLGGAVTRFPDTLKFESLADGLQETLATGSATGQYAELLERMGVNLDDFNKALENAKTAEEDQQIALAYLTQNGLATAYQGYKDTNKELLAAEEATLRLNDAMAGFGEVIDKYIAPAKSFLADVIGGFTTLATDGAEAAYGMSDEAFWTEMAKKSAGTFGKSDKWFRNDFEEAFANIGEAFWKEMAKESERIFGKSDKWFRNDFGEAFANIGEGLLNLLIPSAGAEELPTAELQDYGFTAAQEIAMGMQAGMENNAAVDAAVKTAIAEMQAEDVLAEANLAGKNIMIEFGNGIAEGTSIPLNNVANMVNQINAMLSRIAAPAFGLGWNGMTGGNVYLYNQQKNAASIISGFIGSGVQNQILKR